MHWVGRAWLLAALLVCSCGSGAPASPGAAAASAVPAASLVGGGAARPAGLAFPQQAPVAEPRVVMEALLFGRLVKRQGCLRVEADVGETSYLVVWPPEVQLRRQGEQVLIADAGGAAIVMVGQRVRMGGGMIDDAAGVESRQPLSEGLPPDCSGPYWVAGEGLGPAGQP